MKASQKFFSEDKDRAFEAKVGGLEYKPTPTPYSIKSILQILT